jgi:predicted RNase H-like HicB family nuclease
MNNTVTFRGKEYTVTIEPIPADQGGGYAAYINELGKFAFIGDGETPEEAIDDLQDLCYELEQMYDQEGF